MSTLVETSDLTSDQLTALATIATALGKTSAVLALEMLTRAVEIASSPSLFTQADLELRIGGPRILVQLCDDNGDGTADVPVVAYVKREASKIAKGLLFGAWPNETQIETMVANDEAMLGYVCDIAAGLCGNRRPEWVTNDGKPFFGWRMDRGMRELKALAVAQMRSPAEAIVGTNGTIGPRLSPEPQADRQFLPTRKQPMGRGGF